MAREPVGMKMVWLSLFLNFGLLGAVWASNIFVAAELSINGPYRIREYTPEGDLVNDFGAVPYPDSTNLADQTLGDLVVDSSGKIHVFNSGRTTLPDYLSTYNPESNTWSHQVNPVNQFSDSSQGDLSLLGNSIVNRTVLFDIVDQTTSQFTSPSFGSVFDLFGTFNGITETIYGLDGLLYVIAPGFSTDIGVLDPSDFSLLRSFPLSNLMVGPFDDRLDARGLAVDRDGQIFLADWDGYIHEINPDGSVEQSLDTGVSSLFDLNINEEGVLVAGSRFGEVVVTDTELSTLATFEPVDGDVYVALQSIPEPSSLILSGFGLVGLLCSRRR